MIDSSSVLDSAMDDSGSFEVLADSVEWESRNSESTNISPPPDSSSPWDVKVLPWSELTPTDLEIWQTRRNCQPNSNHAFFAPRFAGAIDAVRGDVLVAMLGRNVPGGFVPAGFFPFHRVGRIGLPVGRFFNDAQCVIGIPPDSVDWTSLMRAADVVAFDLHAIVNAAESWHDRYRLRNVGAYRSDFQGDSPAFLRQLEKEHRTIGKQGQKTRKLGREIGELRLEIDCTCSEVLDHTIAWKRAQYQRTHILDLFHPQWTRDLTQYMHGDAMRTDDSSDLSLAPLRGLLSVLWAGDHVVAAHFGMIECGRLHYWFPTYDPQYARYSPGTALFTELVRAASSAGIDCIDMGYGEQPYKQKQTATTTTVSHGTITDSQIHRWRFHGEAKLVEWLKQVPMKEPIKKAWRSINPTAGIGKLK